MSSSRVVVVSAAAAAAATLAAVYYRLRVSRRYHRWWTQPSSADAKLVRVGVLGAAAIAKKNVRAMTLTPNVRCVAVASRTLAKAERFIEELRAAGTDMTAVAAVEGYQKLLEDPQIDAVYIPLPTSMHVEWVRAAASQKKHVLLEKPIALSNADAHTIVQACADAGLQLMDGTMFVHNPRQAALSAAVAEEGFGALRRINSSFSFSGDDDFNASNIRVKKDMDGLGCLGDLGWYNVRASLEAVGYRRPALVQGHPGAQTNAEGVTIDCGATLTWSDGVVATFDCSFRCRCVCTSAAPAPAHLRRTRLGPHAPTYRHSPTHMTPRGAPALLSLLSLAQLAAAARACRHQRRRRAGRFCAAQGQDGAAQRLRRDARGGCGRLCVRFDGR